MRRWFDLSGRERRLFLRAAWQIAVCAIALRVCGLRRALRWADCPISNAATNDANNDGEIRDRRLAFARAGRYVPGGTCLVQSIALTRTLRKKGVNAAVRVGVAVDGTFSAHAWVEVDGVSLAEKPARFTPLSVGSLQ